MKRIHRSLYIALLFSFFLSGLTGPFFPAQAYGVEKESSETGSLTAYKNHWCYSYLKDLAARGYVRGDGSGDYQIDNNITVGEFLTVLSQIDGYEGEGEELDWKQRTMNWNAEAQVADQALIDAFDRPAVRGEAAVLIANYLKLDHEAETIRQYSHMIIDYADVEADHKEPLVSCYIEGIMSGDKNYLRSGDTLKRSESFVLFSKLLHPEKREAVSLEPVFYALPVPEAIRTQMRGVTYHQTARVEMADLRYLKMSCVGFDGEEYMGEMIVHRLVAQEVLDIFKELYDNRYPIEKMALPDVYNGSDEMSMRDNNTSAFNDRSIASSSAPSYHQMGLAVDINPLYNPYYNSRTKLLQPETAGAYLDRTKTEPAYITKNDICYNAFVSRGWTWGGSWSNPKDYQHFEKQITVAFRER